MKCESAVRAFSLCADVSPVDELLFSHVHLLTRAIHSATIFADRVQLPHNVASEKTCRLIQKSEGQGGRRRTKSVRLLMGGLLPWETCRCRRLGPEAAAASSEALLAPGRPIERRRPAATQR